MLESVEHFFSPAEVSDLEALPAPERADRFFQVWTLKESYIKAHGKGLSMPLAEFSFRFTGTRPDAIFLEPGPGDSAERWQFWLWNPTPEHTLGLTAAFPRGAPVNLRVETTIPLA
jgi:4'-phosphopantetheinyl transferase